MSWPVRPPMVRRLLIVTSGRADASPLAPVAKELQGRCEPWFLAVRGTDPFRVVGYAANCVADEIARFQPEALLVLGDRAETLAACLAATVAKVPIAHIHGGERTLGSYDDRIRDAITVLAKWHFTATQQAANRVWELTGSLNIFTVGAPGLDAIVDLPERKPTKTFVLTYHPETAGDDAELLALVEALGEFPDYEVIWTGVNSDPGADKVRDVLARHYTERKLTPREYILACRQAALVVGNSSSGIIEAPTIGVPSIDVGRRQEGRERGPSIFSTPCDAQLIVGAIRDSLTYTGPFSNPYYRPGASKAIADILVAA